MGRWDCSREGHTKCIAKGQTFECNLPANHKRYSIASREDLEACIADIKTTETKSEDIGICIRLGVCPVGLIDAFTWEAWTLFNALKDGAPWPWSYYEQPAVYARAARIFESELLIIRKEEEAKERGRSGKV